MDSRLAPLGVASVVAVPRERNPAPVRRPCGFMVLSFATGDLAEAAAVGVDDVDVSSPCERQIIGLRRSGWQTINAIIEVRQAHNRVVLDNQGIASDCAAREPRSRRVPVIEVETDG